MKTKTEIDELVKRLREAARTGKPDGWTMLAVSEWNDAADVIEFLQRENKTLKEALEDMALEMKEVMSHGR